MSTAKDGIVLFELDQLDKKAQAQIIPGNNNFNTILSALLCKRAYLIFLLTHPARPAKFSQRWTGVTLESREITCHNSWTLSAVVGRHIHPSISLRKSPSLSIRSLARISLDPPIEFR